MFFVFYTVSFLKVKQLRFREGVLAYKMTETFKQDLFNVFTSIQQYLVLLAWLKFITTPKRIVLFFCFLLHRLAARISLPFHIFLQVLIQVYKWEIQHHSLVCRCGLADNLHILAHELPDTMIKKQAINELLTKRLECFHSRGQ